jgi:cell division protein ZapA
MAKEIPPSASGYVTVHIYDQAYHLRGQNPDHIHRLAALVDSKMRAVAAHGRTVDSLRVAVLAALNLADELSQTSGVDAKEGRARAAHLAEMLDEVLEDERKVAS